MSKEVIIEKLKTPKIHKEKGEVEVKVEDVELVSENIVGKIKLEIKSGV